MHRQIDDNLEQYIWINEESLDTIYKYPNCTLVYASGNIYDKFTGRGLDIIDEKIDIVLDNMDKKLKEYFTGEIIADLEFFMFKNWISFKEYPQSNCKIKIHGSREAFYPAHLAIELTDKCNLACKHCYRDANTEGEYINKEKLFEAIDKAVLNGLSIVELTGGEVTLHPDFCEIVDYLCMKLDIVAVLTNGYYYNDKIVNCLIKNKDKLLINVSIDSSYPEYHDSFRGKVGAWEKSCGLIRKLTSEGLLVRMAMSVTPGNMFDVENTITLAKKMNVRSFAFETVSGFGRGSEIDWTKVPGEEMRKYYKTTNQLNKKYCDMLTLIPAKMCRMMNNEEINCGAGWRTFAVGPDGSMRFCVNTPVDMLSLGNFLENKKEIYKKEIINDLAKTPVPTYHRCKKCNRYIYCQGCLLKGVIAAKNNDECEWKGRMISKKCNVQSSPFSHACKNTLMQ